MKNPYHDENYTPFLMRYFYQFFIVLWIVALVGILQTGAWSGIIAQPSDILNIAKWNEMANQVLISLTQSGNTFGTKVIVGSNDNQPLALETNGTERVTVLSGGNVGIGVVNPQAKFEIDSGIANNGGLRLNRLTNTSPVSSGNVITLGVTSTGYVTPVPNGFPTILRTTATQANTSTITYTNINNLQIPVVVGKTYIFKAYVVYNSAATTTGIRVRFTAPSVFWYSAIVNSTTTAAQYRALYNNGTTSLASTASVGTTGNVATIEGTIIPTTSGTGIIQFATEIAGSAITIQPDSILQYYTY